MPVPKKRKKLDDENLNQSLPAEDEKSQKSTQTSTKRANTRINKPKEDKVNQAFEVVDKIESTESVKAIELQKIYPPPMEQGIHVRFKLDLVSLDDFVNLGNPVEKKENSIVFDFTIPYIWNLPIIHEVTKTIIIELKKMRIIK